MGTYSFWDYYETFGGLPEPGETYPDDPDALRDMMEEEEIERWAEADVAEMFEAEEPSE